MPKMRLESCVGHAVLGAYVQVIYGITARAPSILQALVTHTDSRTLYIQADHCQACPAQVSLQLHVHSADIFILHGQIMSRTEDAACASCLDQNAMA